MATQTRKRNSGRGATRKAPAKKRSSRSNNNGSQSHWRWFGTGVLSGLLLALVLYLGTLPPQQPPVAEQNTAQTPGLISKPTPNQQTEAAPAEPAKPQFDFYTVLPEQSIDVEVAPEEIAQSRTSSETSLYILQAGSFKQEQDAERRRAELLLLGLEPKVQDTTGENGRWFRVYVGPFESKSKLAKARSLMAAQNIDSLMLKRAQP